MAWLFAAAFVEKPRDRRLVVLAGVLSDVDGVFILFDRVAFNQYHHTFGHSFLFGIPLALSLALLANNRRKTAAAALGTFSLHLLADLPGAWPITPFYPLLGYEASFKDSLPAFLEYDSLVSMVNAAILVFMLLLMYHREASPLEFFSKKLDEKLVRLYIYPLKYKCQLCGRWAFIECSTCHRMVCPKHVGSFPKWCCSECGKLGKKGSL